MKFCVCEWLWRELKGCRHWRYGGCENPEPTCSVDHVSIGKRQFLGKQFHRVYHINKYT